MNTIAKDLISQYGQDVKITTDQNSAPKTTKAFIQPIRYDDNKTLDGHYFNLATDDNDKFLYIGLPMLALTNIHLILSSYKLQMIFIN